jgi:hypothetical protein
VSSRTCASATGSARWQTTFLLELLNATGSTVVLKDAMVVPGLGRATVDFDNWGLTLLHCHRRLQMDYGFITLIEYA